MADPFTIRVFVPDGDPEGVRIIDRLNWTGLGIAFPREHWFRVRTRAEFGKTGVYILVGHTTDDDLPTLYIGQGDGIRNRIDEHAQKKDFWEWAITFVSNAANGGLNRAHITWLEYALINRAQSAKRSHLDNGNTPQEPALSEAEKADTQGFLKEVLQILPLAGLRAFERPKAVATPMARSPETSAIVAPPSAPAGSETDDVDTVVVPAQKEGFEEVFLGENAWRAIRIARGMLPRIKYIAAYQTQPISAVTHVAPVAAIEPYGESGKYMLRFSEPAQPIGPIPFGDATQGAMQGPRYTSIARLRSAKTVADLVKPR
ncbi:GIY-YIG nuclease family protein [Methylobacterium sp. 88A]|uniref:GIY-YIG nuclease family protein n=1 Tax=Methylobacterium sp. 88A TaxID=1131813 RepID=UPI0003642C3A|nr:GIY-YIG nuclease family protein [Methylobacterium sp. 88A]